MNEASARAVLLLQAFETAQPPSPSWSDDDRAWATRLALDAAAPDAETFIAQRARHAMQRLAPREPAAASWLARRLWRARWVGWAVLAGLVVGALADSIGSGQRINLLAPPLWAVLAWNALVYLVLLGHGLARLLMRPTRRVRRPMARAAARARCRPLRPGGCARVRRSRRRVRRPCCTPPPPRSR